MQHRPLDKVHRRKTAVSGTICGPGRSASPPLRRCGRRTRVERSGTDHGMREPGQSHSPASGQVDAIAVRLETTDRGDSIAACQVTFLSDSASQLVQKDW